MFMIADGKGLYIRKDINSKYVPVRSISLGERWEERSKAQNVLCNCINKNIRSRFSLIELEEKDIPKKNIIKPKNDLSKKIANKDIKENKINVLMTEIEKLNKVACETENRRKELTVELSNIDKEISDINHYIEFGENFNAYQGWLAFKMLKNRFIQRREIKNELHILAALGDCKIDSNLLKSIKDSAKKVDEQKYNPRILKELFE